METLHVLTADDEAQMRRAVDRTLSNYRFHLPEVEGEVGFTVEQAASGEEALEIISVRPPDILLLDHKMGGMSGLDVLDHLAGKEPNFLTLMVTAYASLETAVAATKRGAFDFIAKPFTPAELKDTIRKATTHLLAQRQARKLAAEKRQLRFQFISVLAHELKAPLGAIEGYMQILKDPAMRQDPASAERMIQRCLVRTEGMRKLIYDLLDLTRIESGTKKRDLAEIDLVDVAKTAIETAGPQAAERGVAIELHANAPVVMIADRGEIEIVLNNLVSNGIKYNRQGGRVDITIGTNEDFGIIEVADTGIGMTPQETNRLFQEFVRIKNTKTKNILGSGLGLSTLRRVAQLYGGDASVASEPDVGSTFTVRLLRKTTENTDHEPAENPELVA